MTSRHEEVFLVTKTVDEVLLYWSSRMVKYQTSWYNATFYPGREDAETCAKVLNGVVLKYSIFIDNPRWDDPEQ